jgi:hypothetical protein
VERNRRGHYKTLYCAMWFSRAEARWCGAVCDRIGACVLFCVKKERQKSEVIAVRDHSGSPLLR